MRERLEPGDAGARLARLGPTPRQVPASWARLLVPDHGRLTLAGNRVQLVGALGLLVGAVVRWLGLVSPAPDWLVALAPGAALMLLGSGLRFVGGQANRAAREAHLARAPVVAAGVIAADPMLELGRGVGRLRLVYTTSAAQARDVAWARALAVRLAAQDAPLGVLGAERTGGPEARVVELALLASTLPEHKAKAGDVVVGVEVAPGELRLVPVDERAEPG